MPTGRLGAVAGSVWIGPLHYGVNIGSLRAFRATRKENEQIKTASICEQRRTLRDAFRLYRIDRGRGSITATELRKKISQILKAAQHFVAAPSWDSADQFLTKLESERYAETVIRQGLRVSGNEWVHLKKGLRGLLSGSTQNWKSPATFAEQCVQYAAFALRIAQLNLEALVPESGRWRDPALAQLVFRLAPLWEQITGYTAAQSTDRIEGTKEFPFAAWLEKMHDLLGFKAPPRGAILDAVLGQKNPASVIRRKMCSNSRAVPANHGMVMNLEQTPPKFLRRKQAASYLKEKYGFGAERTLAKLAVIGGGPVMVYAGRIPLYSPQALDAYALGKLTVPVHSTSERKTDAA